MSRITLLAVLFAVIDRRYAESQSGNFVEIKTRNDPQDDDQFSAACYSGSQKPAPHSMTRRQYKTLVLPRRSRKSKRR